jgi:hypothetical protein
VTVTVENADVEGPAVSVTSPAAGATVTGVATIAANASDPSGVSQVQFRVDGVNVGAPDSTAPYAIQWGSINVPNGSHTLTAVARDSLGNQRTSAGVGVTVNNQDGVPVDALPPKTTPTPPGTTPPGGTSGGTAPGGSNPNAPNLAPALSKLKLSPARFRVGARTKISFRLSEPAKVVLTFDRKLSGRRVRGRCVKASKSARPNCTRYARVPAKLTVNGKAGSNSISFRGRLSRTRALAVGRYRLTLQASDPTGRKSAPARASFTLRQSVARAAALAWF